MKFIYVIFMILVFISCQTTQKLTKNNPTHLQNINCPDSGDCSFEILKDSKLLVKTDDFGKLYPEIVSGKKIVIKYQFTKKTEKENKDGSYNEFVYFEIDPDAKQIILKNNELQKVKMLFGRICYCKKAMGYFRITQGELFLFNKNRKLQVKLDFQVNKVPQIITYIAENIKY